jgi:hypothetical protein
LINLNDLKGHSALSCLEQYDGTNPYLIKLKNEYLKNNKVKLTENQIKYILDNHNSEPQQINRVIGITKFLGEELQRSESLSFTPERILIEYILAENEKTFHIYGKLKKNQQESKMYWLPKTQVTEDPYFTPIDVNVDFTKYNNVLAKSDKKLYQHQEEGVKFLLSRNGCILADDMGLGKGVIINTLAITPTGTKRFGDLKVGDRIIGSNGKPCNIIGVYPQGTKDIYKITFNDGYSITTDGSHLWTVSPNNSGENTYVTISTEQMLDENFVLEQKETGYKFKTFYKEKNGDSKWQIPIVKPIEFENEYELPIEPYSFGLASGNNDFIPNIYKYSSIENRLAILQGFMDTDGLCMKSKNGKFNSAEYSTTSERLADDVAEIVHSLGGIVRKKSKIGEYKKVFKLKIKLPKQFNPFKVKEKADEYNSLKKYKIGRYIKNIEPCGQDETVCIAVDAPDKLYVTEHAIVTHNTTQSIVAALESGANRILIVCPSAVKINWEREINTFCDDTAIVDGRRWKQAKFTIINFDILKNFHTILTGNEEPGDINRHLVAANFDLAIIDEAHNLKNNKSIRGEIMVDLCVKYNIPKVWLLTGTPIANRPMDFFNLLKIIKSPLADNWMFFAKRYCDAKKMFRTLKNGSKKQIWLTDGASNLDELSVKTKNLIIRRLKTDVLDMPDKVITPVYHQLDKNGWVEYDRLWDDYLEKRKAEGKRTGNLQKDLVELILLRKFIALQAIPKTIELAENALELGRKVIIFTNFTDELNELADYFGKACVTHNGPMSDKEKQKSVDSFQNKNNVRLFIGNIKSAGVGITLTEATVVIFNSFDWVPGNNQQAEDRSYRIGQKNDVNIYYQLFEDTISTKMWEILRNKKDVISTIMGDKQMTEEEIILALAEKLDDENYG